MKTDFETINDDKLREIIPGIFAIFRKHQVNLSEIQALIYESLFTLEKSGAYDFADLITALINVQYSLAKDRATALQEDLDKRRGAH